jgi:tight adherence protein B
MDAILLSASLVFLAASIFCLTPPAYARLSAAVARFEERTEATLQSLFLVDVAPRTVTAMVGAFTLFCVFIGVLLAPPLLGLAVGVALGLFVPWFFIGQMVKRRSARLEAQLLDGLVTLANGMRAGLNLAQAMALIEKHSDKPISQEFGLMIREIEHGTAVDVALDNAARRLKSHNYGLLFAAMKTTRLRGGNMPETLDRLSESLREIIRLEEKIKAQTAQGRASAILMGVMPLVVLGIYSIIDSSGVQLLFHDPSGWGVLTVAALLNLAGFLWFQKVVSFDF